MFSLIAMFLLIFSGTNSSFGQTMMPIPSLSSTYTGNVRGYWFTAPTDFVITGLRVPTSVGSGDQSIEVIKINGTVATYPTLATNFTSLYYANSKPNGQIIHVSIPVSAGDQIGILGQVGTTTGYGGTNGYSSSINGAPVTLNRLISQATINSSQAPHYSYVTDATSELGLIEMYYSDYCIPYMDNALDYIDDFSTTGGITNISNLGTGPQPNGYGKYTSKKVSQNRGASVSFTANYPSSYTYGVKIWVDWNQDNVFSTSEVVYSSSAYASSHSGTFSVPASALLGSTRMRVGITYLGSSGPSDPCLVSYDLGEFEDYTFEVLSNDCADHSLPEGLAANANMTGLCGNGTVTLSINSETGYDNLTYQWQSSANGTSGWTNVGSAQATSSYTTANLTSDIWYRCKVLCHSSEIFTTDPLPIKVSHPEVLSSEGDSRCGDGTVTLNATGSTGSTIEWYDAATGGNHLGSGNSFTTPSISATTTYYAASNAPTENILPLPANMPDYTGYTRGYWFVAPSDFTITGLKVNSLTAGSQNIAVLKFDGNTPPPEWSSSTNAFSTLYLTQNNPTSSYVSVDIDIHAGEVIGILGDRAGAIGYSYTAENYQSKINGSNVVLTRMGYQGYLASAEPIGIWSQTDGNIGLIQFTYETKCESSREPVVAEIITTPAPTIDGINITQNSNGSYTFSAINPQNVTDYEWSFGDGNTSTEASPTHWYGSTGNYTVSLVVSNACGTQSFIDNVDHVAGLSSFALENNWKIYPNPASDNFTVEVGEGSGIQQIIVYNIQGGKVFESTTNGVNSYQLDVNSFAPGMYQVKIQLTDGYWGQRKVNVMR